MKVFLSFVFTFFCFFFSVSAQNDSTKPKATPNSTFQGTNGETVPPIIVQQQQPRKRNRKRLTAADSLRIKLRLDSIAQKNTANTAATPANGSAFNIGTTPAPIAADTSKVNKVNATPNEPAYSVLSQSENPFDILRATNVAKDTTKKGEQIAPIPKTEASKTDFLSKGVYTRNFIFWVILGMLIFSMFIIPANRHSIQTAYQSLINDSALRLNYREQLGWGNLSYLALYALFCINAGIFIFLLLGHFGINTGLGQTQTLAMSVGGVIGAYTVKHLILYFISVIFPIDKEIRLYNYIILLSGILMGIVLTPVNIFLAYSPESLSSVFIYVSFGALAIIFSIRLLRSLFVASPYLLSHKFHFFIYLCKPKIFLLASDN